MLKITYSDEDILMEQLAMAVETVVAQRCVLALRVGQQIVVQPGYGSLLLPAQLPGVQTFQSRAKRFASLAINTCDYDWLEVSLRGTWVAETSTSEQGILVLELDEEVERQLVGLWRSSLTWVVEVQHLPKAC